MTRFCGFHLQPRAAVYSSCVLLALTTLCHSTQAQTFSNPGAIQIPNSILALGPSSPYPSPIVVSGVGTQITSITVSLFNFSHAYPDDVDVLLVSPGGINLLLMSDCGGLNPVNGLTFTFSAAAGMSLSDAGVLTSGTFLPTNFDAPFDVDSFAAPAPLTGPYGSSFSAYNGTNPNGVWSLYVIDDTAGNNGSIAGGWSLTIAAVPEPSSMALALGGFFIVTAAARRRYRKNRS